MRCCCGQYDLIDADDRVTFNGRTHEVLGPPGNFCGPTQAHDMRDLQDEVDRLRAERLLLLRQNKTVWAMLNGVGLRMYDEKELEEQLLTYAKTNADEIAAYLDGLKRAAEIVKEEQERPLCMCFAGCPDCTDRPTALQRLEAEIEEVGK